MKRRTRTPPKPLPPRAGDWILEPASDLPLEPDRERFPPLRTLADNAIYRALLQMRKRMLPRAVRLHLSDTLVLRVMSASFLGPILWIVFARIFGGQDRDLGWQLEDTLGRLVAGVAHTTLVIRLLLSPMQVSTERYGEILHLRRVLLRGEGSMLPLARLTPADYAAAAWGSAITPDERVGLHRTEVVASVLSMLGAFAAILPVAFDLPATAAGFLLWPVVVTLGYEARLRPRRAEALLASLSRAPLIHRSDLAEILSTLPISLRVLAVLAFLPLFSFFGYTLDSREFWRAMPPAARFTILLASLLLARAAGELLGARRARIAARDADRNFELLTARLETLLPSGEEADDAPARPIPPVLADYLRARRQRRLAIAAVLGLAFLAALPTLNHVRHIVLGVRSRTAFPSSWRTAHLQVHGAPNSHHLHYLRRGAAVSLSLRRTDPRALDVVFGSLEQGGSDSLRSLEATGLPPDRLDGLRAANLRSLYLTMLSPGPLNIGFLDRNPDLEYLTLEGLSTPVDLDPIGRHATLRYLGFGLPGVPHAALLVGPRLERLSLTAAPDATDLVLADPTRLRSLAVNGCARFQSFEVAHQPELFGISLADLPALERVELEDLPKLEMLDIHVAPSLRELDLPELPALRSLVIRDAASLTSLRCAGAPRLAHLRLLQCPALTELEIPPPNHPPEVILEAPALHSPAWEAMTLPSEPGPPAPDAHTPDSHTPVSAEPSTDAR